MRIGSLCTGYGGLDLAVGGDIAWLAEFDKHAAKVCSARFPEAPNLGDLTTVDWSTVEPVDVITAGYPCQPFSHAGKRKGIHDDRHIWPNIRDAVSILRPRHVVLENVPGHLTSGFGDVLGSLAEIGYDAEWSTVRASDVGAPHRRDRVFILASVRHPGHNAGGSQLGQQPQGATGRTPQPSQDAPPDSDQSRREGAEPAQRQHLSTWGDYAPAVERWERVLGRPAPDPTTVGTKGRPVLAPRFVEWMMGLPAGWVTDVPNISRTQQLKILGNGVVPQQATHALHLLTSSPEEVPNE